MTNPELLSKLSTLQDELWPTVSEQILGATGRYVQLNAPLVSECPVSELLEEFAAPTLIVQFSLAGQQGSQGQIIIPLETATALCTTESEVEAVIDDATVASLRPTLECLVQGLCVAIGNLRNEVVVVSDVSTRLGRFGPPPSLQADDALIRIGVALAIDATIGSLTWVMDPQAAHFVAGAAAEEEIRQASFQAMPSFGSSRAATEEPNGLEILMDVPLDISVELGRTRMVVKQIVDLGVGSIVEIEKAAGEPVDILVNGRIVARGEVVVIEDNFGVRITEILNPRERLARLKEAA